jgi:hypothetical protein
MWLYTEDANKKKKRFNLNLKNKSRHPEMLWVFNSISLQRWAQMIVFFYRIKMFEFRL